MMLFFMAFNLLEVILPSLVSKISPAGARGTAMGVYSTAQFFGAFVGGTAGGLMLSWWDISHLMYANALLCGVWFFIGVTMKKPADMSSRTIRIPKDTEAGAIDVWEALSSVDGVLDVVVIEEEGVAYLKVDNDRFKDEALDDFEASRVT
ncbi:MAG: MFS transporter [Pseudomonadales bacterium]|nr:MFS transporter [Pseudomonadales bacterium]